MRWLPMSAGALVLTPMGLQDGLFAGCWGHRDNILNRFGQASCVLAMDAGHAAVARGYRESDTVLMVGICGHAPTDAMFTWAKAKKLPHIR
jgi:hypothetical protein